MGQLRRPIALGLFAVGIDNPNFKEHSALAGATGYVPSGHLVHKLRRNDDGWHDRGVVPSGLRRVIAG